MSLTELESRQGLGGSLAMMHGPFVDGKGLSATKMTLASLSLANMGIPLLASLLLSHHCSFCESVSPGLHIVAKCYEATNYQKLCFYLQCELNYALNYY